VSDKPDLVRLCYRRSAQALEDALMAAETTTGLAVQKLDVFLDWMFAARAERGCLLPLALAEGPTRVDVLWCRDKERAIRTRLERMIRSGQRDGSINARDAGAACHLILALLQSPEVPVVAGTSSAGLDELKQLIFGGLAAR
jgi:hypothetical protein